MPVIEQNALRQRYNLCLPQVVSSSGDGQAGYRILNDVFEGVDIEET